MLLVIAHLGTKYLHPPVLQSDPACPDRPLLQAPDTPSLRRPASHGFKHTAQQTLGAITLNVLPQEPGLISMDNE